MRYLKIFLVSAVSLLFLHGLLTGCFKKAVQPCSPAEVSYYFINPSPAAFTSIASRPTDTGLLSDAFRAARSRAIPGTAAEWLTDSAGMPYCVGYMTPPSIAGDTVYPLIIYLHGGITGTERNDKGDSAFFMLKPLADTFKLFLASPSANRYTPWWSPAGLSRILQCLRFMALRFPVNPDKVFLAGVSDGATGCYAAANTICAPFAGFIAVSGFGGMLPTLGMRLAPRNLMQRPIYNVNAGLDHIYPVENVKEFIRLLQEQGVRITFRIYPDEKHGFDYRGKEMGALAAIIRTWSRPASTGISWVFIPGYPNLPDNLLDWTFVSDNASINAFWRCDTLVISENGITSLTAAFSGATPAHTIFLRLVSDNGKIRTRRSVKPDWPRSLELMVHRCFPAFTGTTALCTIKF